MDLLRPTVAIIKTKSVTIPVFSSPLFLLLAFSFSPLLFLRYFDFQSFSGLRNLPFDTFSLKWLQISLGWFSQKWLDIYPVINPPSLYWNEFDILRLDVLKLKKANKFKEVFDQHCYVARFDQKHFFSAVITPPPSPPLLVYHNYAPSFSKPSKTP